MKNKTNETRQVGKRIGLLSTNTTRALLFVFTLLLYTGNVSGGGFHTGFKTATSGTDGKGEGYVYGSTSNTPPTDQTIYYKTKTIESESDDLEAGSNTKDYYAWAQAVRGSQFIDWTIEDDNDNGISSTSSTVDSVTVTVHPKQGGTNTGTATANFIKLTPSNVTCHASEYGSYSISFSYKKKSGDDTKATFSDTTETYEVTGEQYATDLYSTDKVTLKVTSNKDGFLGWYSDADFENPLKDTYTATTYTYTVEDGATEAIYAKFAPSKTFYGKLTTQIASSSIGSGGKIYASTTETANPAYTDQPSTIDATPKTSNMEATSATQTYYLYAQPTDVRYVFRGWFNNEKCTGEPLSNDYSMEVASEDEENPTRDTLYACFDLIKPYYLQVNALAADPLTGMVLVSKENRTNPDYKLFEPYSSATIVASATNVPPTATAYVYAEPSYGYSFEGWYADAACKTTKLSTDKQYAYSAKADSTNAADPTRKNLYAKFTKATTVDITFILPTNGQYTASAPTIIESNGEYVWEMAEVYNSTNETPNKLVSLYPTNHLILSATPEEDYGVQSWTDGSDTITTVLNTYQTTITSAKTLGVTFKESKPYFLKGTDQYFSDLQAALDTAYKSSNKVVVVVQNACVPAGTYTIPSGVTLLVPNSTANTVSTNEPVIYEGTGTAPTPFCTLTLESAVHITVNGSICVNAVLRNSQNSNGAQHGQCGMINMNEGSTITLNNAANLYCWGIIYGKGEITANSGATVYESFQVNDYPGGTFLSLNLTNYNKYKVFPVRIYCFSNIQSKLHLHHGATEKVATVFATDGVGLQKDIAFISTDNGLFITKAGSVITKWYDKDNDLQMYQAKGSCDLKSVELKIASVGSVNSANFILPITHNMHIELLPQTNNISSTVVTLTNDIAIHPGAKILVNKNVTVQIAEKKALYVYDLDQWENNYTYAGLTSKAEENKNNFSIIYGRNAANKRSFLKKDLSDAVLEVAGTVEINGALYTTSSGANIKGVDGGKVIWRNDAPANKNIYQSIQSGKYAGEWPEISVTAAQLHNNEEMNPTEPYTKTSGAAANDVFVYNKDMGKWLKNPVTVTWDANGGTCETKTTALESGKPLGVLPVAHKKWYKFKGWYTAASDGDTITSATTVMTNITYYAQYEFVTKGDSLDIVDADGTNLTINANGWASSGWPYKIKDKYRFKGVRAEDRTLTIPYSGTPNTDIPIVLKDKEGTVVSSHIYKVPFVYTGTENMDAMNENSIVFVKSGTLQTTDGAKAKEIYVADSAELEVTGKLTVGKLVLRTTPYKAAVLTIETDGSIALADGGQVFYSRIAPNKSTIKDLHGDTTTYNSARYYQFGLPLSCPISSVTMSNAGKLGGSQPKYGTAWMLKSYSESSRAENGISNEGANWSLLPSEGTITAGVGYEMFSNSNYYREFYFPVDLTTATDTVSVQYTKGTKEEHNGWNIITSPLTSRANVPIIDPATAIKPCWLLADGSYTQEIPEIIPPAVPFAYQTSTADTLNFVVSTAAAAPRRQSAAEAATETEWVHLDIFNNEGRGDETSLFVHPTRFEQDYKPGIDVAKQSLTASRAILYTAHAYGNMAFAGVADTLLENGIDVIVYSPTEQQLTFSLRENAFLNRLEYLWLADNKTGARTDLLLNDYTFRAAAGTDKQRFVLNGRFKAPQISTGIGNTQTDYKIYAIGNNIAISGVEQGTPIYVFDAVGHMIYTTAATTAEVIVPAPCAGVYMLSVGGQTAKLVINQ